MLHFHCPTCARLTRHEEQTHTSGERLPRCLNCGTWRPVPLRRKGRRGVKKNPAPRVLNLEWKKQLRKFGPKSVVDAPLVRQISGASQYVTESALDAFMIAAAKLGIQVSTWRENPAARPLARAIAQARRLGQAFSGHPQNRIIKLRQKPITGPRLAIGRVSGIMYFAKRDGRVQQYLHKFAPRARPLLATNTDGSRLELLGGAFRFTERGIVDRRVTVKRQR